MTQVESVQRLGRRKIPTTANPRSSSSIPAWLLSGLLHTAVLIVLGLFWTARPHGTSGQQGGPVGIAVVFEAMGEDQYYLMDDAQPTDSSIELSTAALPSAQSARDEQEALLSGLMPRMDDTGGANAAGDLGLATGKVSLPTGGRAGAVKAELFGVEGEGSRFVYVIDRSDSMNGFQGKPMQRAKAELLQSLDSLGPTHQFQIIFYNDTPSPYGGSSGRGPQLLRGDDRSKQSAARFVKEMIATGGTNHIDALRMAISMAPDVIFFLTDGDLPKPSMSTLDSILTRAARSGSTIHCIHFGEGPRTVRSSWISYLSESSGGNYRYINVFEF
jgi:hypothetical protein